jgi:subtilisin family serine protease
MHPISFTARAFGLALLLAAASTAVLAQDKPRIEKAADLPRFSYAVTGNLEETVRSATQFAPLGAALRRDAEAVLSGYEIADKATRRGLLSRLALLDFLDGRPAQALARAEEVKALEDKPADRLMSGLRLRVMSRAAMAHAPGSAAYQKAVADGLATELASMPFEVIANDVRELKASAELIGEALILGGVNEVLQPMADRSGELSSDFAPSLLSARYALVAVLPLKKTLVAAFSTYLDAHRVVKADIWAARDVALPADQGLAPVRVAIWDSGVDTALFKGQLALDAAGAPLSIAYDKYGRPSPFRLQPLPAEVKRRLPTLLGRTEGFSDLQSNIDSAAASEVKQWLSSLQVTDYRRAVEELGLIGNFEHGTHVAGIALAGNPYARLVVGRIEFDHRLQPDPCPSHAGALREAAAAQATVAYFQAQQVRVVNMSWGGSVGGIESAIEQCGLVPSAEARKALARQYFDISRTALTEAFASAPEILFVAAAGNSNEDPSFVEDIPAAIELPNLLTVGAVDAAGDEAGFTSYGANVKVHANGYQVVSYLPGGKRVALSGTSMAAPQVTGLAAKLLAVNPKLKPTELVQLIVDSAERSADGRRVLMHPKKALAAAQR